MKSEVQSVTTNKSKTNMDKYGVRGWQTSGVRKEIHKQSKWGCRD